MSESEFHLAQPKIRSRGSLSAAKLYHADFGCGFMQVGKVKVKVYQFEKAEAANRNTQNKFLCFAVCPPVVLVLGPR